MGLQTSETNEGRIAEYVIDICVRSVRCDSDQGLRFKCIFHFHTYESDYMEINYNRINIHSVYHSMFNKNNNNLIWHKFNRQKLYYVH